MTSYNLTAIRELLNAAFDAGNISNMAFDLSRSVYEEFAPGMTKGQMIRAIVDDAERNGRIPTLLDYVREKNSYQYGRFASHLNPLPDSPPEKPMIDFDEQRLRDLQHLIERSQKLLRQYQTLLQQEKDPRTIMAYEGEIEREREALARHRQEAAELSASKNPTVAAAAHDAQKSLSTISQQIEAVSQQVTNLSHQVTTGNQAIREDLAGHQVAILSWIDRQHQQTVKTILDQLNVNQVEVVQRLMEAANNQQIARWEADQLNLLVNNVLTELDQHPTPEQWRQLLDAANKVSSWQQKLKLILPIIPGLVEFESEAAVDVRDALKNAWQKLVDRVTRK